MSIIFLSIKSYIMVSRAIACKHICNSVCRKSIAAKFSLTFSGCILCPIKLSLHDLILLDTIGTNFLQSIYNSIVIICSNCIGDCGN